MFEIKGATSLIRFPYMIFFFILFIYFYVEVRGGYIFSQIIYCIFYRYLILKIYFNNLLLLCYHL